MSQVAGDSPISDPTADTLGRRASATSFADQVFALDASEGLVVGVLGPWGSGKTSFVNLARTRLNERGAAIVDFNPWMFSGTDQLVDAFFVEVGAQVKLKPGLAHLGDDIQELGEAFSGLGWLPLVGATIERAISISRAIAKAMQKRRQGVAHRRQKLKEKLTALDSPIIVVLDDIDRLTTDEIRAVFRLVRLTASFPNVIYVVAFDRARIEAALSDHGTTGRAYLEKILQLTVELPVVPFAVLTRQVTDALDHVLDGMNVGDAGLDARWPDLFFEIVRPLVRNMRDVRRYAAAVHGTVRGLGGEIALGDLLALEAVRMFLPDVFAAISRSADVLTATADTGLNAQEDPRVKAQIEAIVATATEHRELAKDLILRLFPAAGRHIGGMHYGTDWQKRWLRERFVAHEHHLRHYLERSAGTGLQAFQDAEVAWRLLTDRIALNDYLRSLDEDRLEDVIGALEAYEDAFKPEHVVPGTTVLLNIWPDLPERPRQMAGLDTRMVVRRVVYLLLRVIQDPVEMELTVAAILPELTTLSAKLELITFVGYRKGAGHELVTETAAARVERAWRDEVRAASPGSLAKERRVAFICFRVLADAHSGEPRLQVPDTPEMTAALLRDASGDVLSNTMGTRAVIRSLRLSWEILVDIFDGEEELNRRVDALAAAAPHLVDEELLELAMRYRGGWRPYDPFEDD